MNFLFLVEGSKTEPMLYKAWLEYLFSGLRFVLRPEDMTSNTFRIVEGGGYPNMVSVPRSSCEPSKLEACLLDIKNYHNVDHFFICIDSEHHSYNDRLSEINSKLEDLKYQHLIDETKTRIHIIIQHCCIETWALGNWELVNEAAFRESPEFLGFKNHYNILREDPEQMECCPPGYTRPTRKRQKFHKHYLEVYFRCLGWNYKKANPRQITTDQYLESLQNRCQSTNHLRSLKIFLDILSRISEQESTVIAPEN